MKKWWLFILIVAQPFLDVLAFWTASENGTAAGIIRLGILLICGLYILIRHHDKPKVLIFLAVCIVVFGAHIVNGIRVGYISFYRDISYMSRVCFMPVLALLFCLEIDNETVVNQVIKALALNAIIVTFVIIISYISGTFTYTYGEGLGISGWVTVDNRCCHSDILSSLCIFIGYFVLKYKKIYINVLLPILIFLLLVTNGTRACYVTLYGISIGYPAFIIIRALISHEKPDKYQKIAVISFLTIALAGYIVYPYTPRAKEEEYKRSHFSTVEKDFVLKMESLGYDDVYNMSYEEKLSDTIFYEELKTYYNAFCWGGIPQIVQRFDLDTIIRKYGATIDSGILGNTRTMKQKYASLIMDTQDILTHFTGYEIAQLGDDMIVDLENDYFALLYYYGYLGLGAYIVGALYVFYRIIRLLINKFKENLTDLNFTLLLAFAIQLGLAYFSGAILRRPNASIYICIVIGMIFYETKFDSSSV